MTGEALDRRLREILTAATPDTSLSSTAAIAALGFPPRVAFEIVAKVLIDSDQKPAPRNPSVQ